MGGHLHDIIETKNLENCHLTWGSGGHLLLGMQPTLNSSLIWSPLEEKKVSFASGYPLEIASRLGTGTCFHFSFRL